MQALRAHVSPDPAIYECAELTGNFQQVQALSRFACQSLAKHKTCESSRFRLRISM